MIRVAIGTEPRTEIARKVLEYSIVKNTKSKVEFKSLMGEDYYDRGAFGQGTGFSLLRFSIPEVYDYSGHAIYLDPDMLVLSDISELWDYGKDNNENVIWCKYGNEHKNSAETSVMVINCEKAKGRIKTISETLEFLKDDVERKKYRQIMKLEYLKPAPIEISRWWNVMDKGCVFSKMSDFSSSKVKLLHYTNVRKQPWYLFDHPKKDIWGKWLKMSINEGFVTMKEIKGAIKRHDVSNPRRPNGLHPGWEKYILNKK